MSRFAPLPNNGSGRFANLAERLNSPLPHERAASVPTAPKLARVAPVAQAKPAPKAKTAELLALEANADRAFKVMKAPAAQGKMKAAAELLGSTKLSAEDIVARLPSCQTDDAREKAEIDALWSNASAKVSGRGIDALHAPDVLLRAAAKVNAINGFAGEAV